MTNGWASSERLSVVQRRRRYLETLTDPKHKRDLIDELDDSRSTIDRAIAELHDEGLVRQTNGAWATTTMGALSLSAVDELRETIDAVGAADGLLPSLPANEAVPTALFRDAVVDIADGPAPLSIAERVTSAVATTESLRGFSVADHEVGVKNVVADRALSDESFELDHVFDSSLVEGGHAPDDHSFAEMNAAANNSLSVHDDLPFGLFLTEDGTEARTTVVVYDERNVVRGQVTSTNREAFAWATDLFERYREEASDIAAVLD